MCVSVRLRNGECARVSGDDCGAREMGVCSADCKSLCVSRRLSGLSECMSRRSRTNRCMITSLTGLERMN